MREKIYRPKKRFMPSSNGGFWLFKRKKGWFQKGAKKPWAKRIFMPTSSGGRWI